MSNRKDWSTSTLLDRLDEVRRLRGFTAKRQLARAADLDPGLISRLGRTTTQGTPDTLRKIADATHVSFEWLATGVGRPEALPPGSGERDRYPHREEAARIARDGGIDDDAIEAVLREEYAHLTRDPSVLWWIHQIEALALLGTVPPPRQAAPTPVTESAKRPRRRSSDEK